MKQRRFPTRFKMVFGTFVLAMIVLFDRILISVAKDPIAEDLQLTDQQMGWILSFFALGYALFQAPAGFLADRIGPRKLLSLVVTLWSAFTALSGAVFNFISLLIVRFLFGAGEAGAFPGMARAIYAWIPIKERGIVNGINFSGGRIGAAIALPAVAWLIDLTSWRASFLILGIVGIIWGVIWYLWFRDDPKDHKNMSVAELDLIRRSTDKDQNATDSVQTRLNVIFQQKNMLLLMGQYFASNFTFFFCLTWLFPHLKIKYGLDAMETGLYSSLPLLAGALGNWISGWLVDHLYSKGLFKSSRRIPAMIGFSLTAIGVVASIFMSEILPAVICISLAVYGADMTLSPSWSTCVDIGQTQSGVVSGIMNMAGNLGSFVTALAFPYLLALTGSDQPFFYLTAGMSFLAIPAWLFINPSKSITNLYDQKI